ncbi:hypothetical protein C8R44DRAFT_858282 [Mycena epipterygia]|nr:hypothetical protein C8R44DRAFT_858282 [Mycena epipterygia]
MSKDAKQRIRKACRRREESEKEIRRQEVGACSHIKRECATERRAQCAPRRERDEWSRTAPEVKRARSRTRGRHRETMSGGDVPARSQQGQGKLKMKQEGGKGWIASRRGSGWIGQWTSMDGPQHRVDTKRTHQLFCTRRHREYISGSHAPANLASSADLSSACWLPLREDELESWQVARKACTRRAAAGRRVLLPEAAYGTALSRGQRRREESDGTVGIGGQAVRARAHEAEYIRSGDGGRGFPG